MNIRYLSICVAFFVGLLVTATWANPGLFEQSLQSNENKTLSQDKKNPIRRKASGQSSPFSFGNEVEFETSDGVVYVYIGARHDQQDERLVQRGEPGQTHEPRRE